MKRIYSIWLCMLWANIALAQADSIARPLVFSGYVEAYYGFDQGNPSDHLRPTFMYSHNRHNEFNLNLGMAKVAYSREKVRANLALMAGTYPNANLTAELPALRYVYEANAGFKLSKTRNLWVDAGIFTSHIGFESAIGKDCWNLTRSMLADNSPYYETGAKVSYTTHNGKWFLSGLLLNGWQRMARADGNNTPAFGHQVTWKPNAKVTLNSSSFVGNDKPDSLRQMRYFHNLYGTFQLTPRLGAILGFDLGAEQRSKSSTNYNIWYSPVVILRETLSDRLTLAARGEYYTDAQGVIVNTASPNGFQTIGYSLNADVSILENLIWRIEARGFSSRDKIFVSGGRPSNTHYNCTTSIAVSF